jgi:hypothetical protein
MRSRRDIGFIAMVIACLFDSGGGENSRWSGLRCALLGRDCREGMGEVPSKPRVLGNERGYRRRTRGQGGHREE